MKTNKLKPCPFCGSEKIVGGYPFGDQEITVYACEGCGAEGPTLGGNDSISDVEAVGLWNKRIEAAQ